MTSKFETIHRWLSRADAIVISAGEGLTDYISSQAITTIESQTGREISNMKDPKYLAEHAVDLWSDFADRTISYASCAPENAYYILFKWIIQFKLDYFIVTTNIDEQFEMTGFDSNNILELNGSIFYLQCSVACCDSVWRHIFNFDKLKDNIAEEYLPSCPNCGAIARPNILFFDDQKYVNRRRNKQKNKFEKFLNKNENKSIVVFEIGAGPHNLGLRQKTRVLSAKYNANVVRIDEKNFSIKSPNIGLKEIPGQAIIQIDSYITTKAKNK